MDGLLRLRISEAKCSQQGGVVWDHLNSVPLVVDPPLFTECPSFCYFHTGLPFDSLVFQHQLSSHSLLEVHASSDLPFFLCLGLVRSAHPGVLSCNERCSMQSIDSWRKVPEKMGIFLKTFANRRQTPSPLLSVSFLCFLHSCIISEPSPSCSWYCETSVNPFPMYQVLLLCLNLSPSCSSEC